MQTLAKFVDLQAFQNIQKTSVNAPHTELKSEIFSCKKANPMRSQRRIAKVLHLTWVKCLLRQRCRRLENYPKVQSAIEFKEEKSSLPPWYRRVAFLCPGQIALSTPWNPILFHGKDDEFLVSTNFTKTLVIDKLLPHVDSTALAIWKSSAPSSGSICFSFLSSSVVARNYCRIFISRWSPQSSTKGLVGEVVSATAAVAGTGP